MEMQKESNREISLDGRQRVQRQIERRSRGPSHLGRPRLLRLVLQHVRVQADQIRLPLVWPRAGKARAAAGRGAVGRLRRVAGLSADRGGRDAWRLEEDLAVELDSHLAQGVTVSREGRRQR